MSDTSWESYSADEALTPEVVADVAPIIDVANTDTWQGDHAASWGEWNEGFASDYSASAADEIEYANQLYADGFTEAADAALARADYYSDQAASHSETAADYYGTAAQEYDAAADGYGTAADYLSDATSYDTTSHDTTSYDTTSYDTTSYDTTE